MTVTYPKYIEGSAGKFLHSKMTNETEMVTKRVEATCDSAMFIVKILTSETLECSDSHLTLKSFESMELEKVFTLGFGRDAPFSMSTVVDLSIPLDAIDHISIDLDKYLHYLSHHKRVFFCKNLREIKNNDSMGIFNRNKVKFDFELVRTSEVETTKLLKLLDLCIKNDGLVNDELTETDSSDAEGGSEIPVLNQFAKIDHYIYDQSAPT